MAKMSKGKIIYKTGTEYNDITVMQNGNIITLWSPRTTKQTEIDIANPHVPNIEYARNTVLSLVFNNNPQKILILGLGGGSIPLMFYYLCKNVRIDVVEIDPDMPGIAKTFFNFFDSPRIRLFIEDAGDYIQRISESYDIIVLDTYLGKHIPGSLQTQLFCSTVKKRLSRNGIFVSNLMTSDSAHFNHMSSLINSIFQNMWFLPGIEARNMLTFASNGKIPRQTILANAIDLQATIDPKFQIMQWTKLLRMPQLMMKTDYRERAGSVTVSAM